MSSTWPATVSDGCRPEQGCSFLLTMAPAFSFGTTTPFATQKSCALHPEISRVGARSATSNGGFATHFGHLAVKISGSAAPHPASNWSERLGNDDEARKLLFEWSMVECVEHYLRDERLQLAYLGQGVIGTNASPHDSGTASIHFHHQSGRMGGMAGMWGYVQGGMGMVSFILCDIVRDAGAVVLTGVPVARILPGIGVELEGGDRIEARCIVSNADPRTTLQLLGEMADPAWRDRVEAIPQVGCTVKLNVVLKELPSFKARPGTQMPHHLGQINTPLTKDEWRVGPVKARAGELPDRLWTELYFQTAHDPSCRARGRTHDECLRPVCAPRLCSRQLGHVVATKSKTSRSGRSPVTAKTSPRLCLMSRSSARPTSSGKSG